MAKPPSGLERRNRQTFNSARLVSNLIMEQVVLRASTTVEQARQVVEKAATDEVVKIFRDLALNYMGKDQNLATLLGGDANRIGLRPWLDLSPKYVAHKKSTKFWMYRRLKATAAAWRRSGKEDLRIEVGKINALKALGAPVATVTTDGKTEVTRYFELVQKKTYRSIKSRGGASLPIEGNYWKKGEIIRANIRVDLWQKGGSSKRALASWGRTIETSLANEGHISQQAAIKLRPRGREKPNRPLILPFLVYYRDIKIPRSIRNAIVTELQAPLRSK